MKQPMRAVLPDFETWASLAKEDPARFEALRLEMIDDFITQVPESKRLHLRRIQWRIDQVRERAGTPLAACVALSRMMWDSFSDLRESYQDLLEKRQPARIRRSQSPGAKILAFPRQESVEA